MHITKKEHAAIMSLIKVARKWPDSLWLFSASGTLHVMKCKSDGTRGTAGFHGYDPSCILYTIDIPSDGGDW